MGMGGGIYHFSSDPGNEVDRLVEET